MPFSGQEVSEKGFPRGWDVNTEDETSQRVFRVTQLLEAMVFRPFSWDIFNSSRLAYAYHGGLIDNGVDEWVLIVDSAVEGGSFVDLLDDSTNFIERSDAGVVSVNQVGFTYINFIPMAEITTKDGEIVRTSYIDRRPEIGGAPAGGGGGTITFAQIIGVIFDAQVPLSAVAQHQFNLAISFTQMIDSIADGQVPESAVTQHEAALSILFSQIVGFIDPGQIPVEGVIQYCEEIDACLGAFIPGWEGRLTDLVGWLIARDRKVTIKDNEVFITISPDFSTLGDVLEFLLARATVLPPPHTQCASNLMFA